MGLATLIAAFLAAIPIAAPALVASGSSIHLQPVQETLRRPDVCELLLYPEQIMQRVSPGGMTEVQLNSLVFFSNESFEGEDLGAHVRVNDEVHSLRLARRSGDNPHWSEIWKDNRLKAVLNYAIGPEHNDSSVVSGTLTIWLGKIRRTYRVTGWSSC